MDALEADGLAESDVPQTERHVRWKTPPVEEASDDDRSVVAAAERTEENILTPVKWRYGMP